MFGWFYVAVLALLHLLVVLMRWINPTEVSILENNVCTYPLPPGH